MIELLVNGADISKGRGETLTSGMVNAVKAKFIFKPESPWEGLKKIAVFWAGYAPIDSDIANDGDVKSVTLVDNCCTIPHECLTKAGLFLYIGVCGVDADDNIMIPARYCKIGTIFKGADPNADPALDPSLPIWAEILTSIGDLSQLETKAKDSLVAAINEVARSGGGGSSASGKDGREIELKRDGDYIQWRYAGDDQWQDLIAIADITGPQGKQGKAGEDGYTPVKNVDYSDGAPGQKGKDGYTPIKGVDYFTESDIAEIMAVVLARIPVDTSLAERLAGV